MDNLNEIWLPIKNYEGLYEISNYGRVKSLKRISIVHRNGTETRVHQEQILVFGYSRGYQLVSLSKNNIRKTYRLHRIVALTFIPNPNNKPQVNHKDGVKSNNAVTNLEWATHAENDNHAVINKLHPFGKQHGRAIVDDDIVHAIRLKYIPFKYSCRKLSEEYGIGITTVWHIINDDTWKHMK